MNNEKEIQDLYDKLTEPRTLDRLKEKLRNKPENKKVYCETEKQYYFDFNTWRVYENGDMLFSDYYWIESNRIQEMDWFIHLKGKAWMDWNDFIPAYFKSCKINNRKTFKMKVNY